MQVTFRGQNVKNVYVYIITGGGGRGTIVFCSPVL